MEQLLENALTGGPAPMGPQAAVLAIHWQKDVVAPGGALSRTFARSVGERDVIGQSARLFTHARRAGAPVIYVIAQQEPQFSPHIANNALWNLVEKSGRFMRGTEGVEIVPELAPEKQDVVLFHDRSSCFYGTSLLTYLIGKGIRDLYLTGVATNVAVDHTARDAVQLGYNTYLVEDCCASADMALHEAALLTLRVMCTGIVTAREIAGHD